MTSFFRRVHDYFSRQPKLASAFQVAHRRISGVALSPRERKVKGFFLVNLDERILRPSFSGKNIMDPDGFSVKLEEGLRKMAVSDRNIALLMPEVCQKTFIFMFDSFPESRGAQDKLVRFRIKKQIPKLSEDTIVSFDVLPGEKKTKVLAAIAKKEVVQEYEHLFMKHHLKPGMVGIPVLCLSNLIDWQREKDFILVNVEEDEFGLIAVLEGEIVACRQKSSIERSPERRMDNIIQEIENTVNFIEDRQSGKIGSLWVRLGWQESKTSLTGALKASLPIKVKKVDDLVNTGLAPEEKKALAPLLGQIL